jgi:hypothetical protein
MVAPLLAYAIGKGLESAGLPSGLANPKGYILDQLKGAVDSQLGVAPGTTSLVTDPKSAIAGAAKDFVKNKVKDEFLDNKETTNRDPVAVEDRSFEPSGYEKPDMENMEWEGGYKRGGKVKAKAMPKASSASRRGDGIAQRGKTKGRYL